MKKLIFTSYGLTTAVGRKLIKAEIKKDGDLENKRIFLFHEQHYSIENMLVEACLRMGFKKENIVLSGQQKSNDELLTMDYIYVTEGNTFEIMALLRERGLDSVIQEAFRRGSAYIGASAGAMIAGVSIEEALSFDLNFAQMNDFAGLCLFDGVIIPHYTKEELKRYIKNSPGIEEKYKNIYSVADDKSLVLEEERKCSQIL